jgi:hypothetical protein
VANIGSLTSSPAGEYLVTYDQDDWGVSEDTSGQYAAIIKLPVPYALSVTRILVSAENNDIANVRAIQDGMSITEIARDAVAPAWDIAFFRDPSLEVSIPVAVMLLTAKFAEYQQPIVPGDRAWVANLLANAGIADGTWTLPEGVNLTVAAATAQQKAAANNAANVIDLGSGWTAQDQMGLYYSAYQIRYIIGRIGYLALTPDEAIYPFYNSIVIGASESALFTFSRKPDILPGGFWSMTVYNEEGYLVENPLGRYLLGDRSHLTFPDGTPLEDSDGPFQLLLQPADIEPPANWTSK